MISTRIKVKVQSVKAIRDVEGRESYQIDFVEVRSRPPMGSMTSTELPEEIGQMVVQITKGMHSQVTNWKHSNLNHTQTSSMNL